MIPREPPAVETVADATFDLPTTMKREAAYILLARRFRALGFEEPEREASMLLAAAGVSRLVSIADPDAPLAAAAARIGELALRRTAGEPLTRILGRREFWSLDFRITPDVLDPRPDTETIVEAALAELAASKAKPLRILDLGVGSGAILAALLRELPNAVGLGVDRSAAAAQVASQNLQALGFAARADVRIGDWGEGLLGLFDLILSNPPYIPSAEIETLSCEVRDHDPRLALDGGVDGLDAYRSLCPQIARLIEPSGGRFALEFGAGQGAAVQSIARAAGLDPMFTRADLGGVERVVVGSLKR